MFPFLCGEEVKVRVSDAGEETAQRNKRVCVCVCGFAEWVRLLRVCFFES